MKLSDPNLDLGFAFSPETASRLIEEPEMCSAYPLITAKCLFNLLKHSPNSKQISELFSIILNSPDLQSTFESVLNHAKPPLALHGESILILFNELVKHQDTIVNYQYLVIALLKCIPSTDLSDEWMKKWFHLFALLTKKNLLQDFPADFFVNNNMFTLQAIPYIKQEKDARFLKYFEPFLTPCALAVLMSTDSDASNSFLDFCFENKWLPPIQPPFDTHTGFLKKMMGIIAQTKKASNLLKDWTKHILRAAFTTSFLSNPKDEETYMNILEAFPEQEPLNFLENIPLAKMHELALASPKILISWLRNLSHSNRTMNNVPFACQLMSACYRQAATTYATDPSFYNEIIEHFLVLHETFARVSVPRNFQAEKPIKAEFVANKNMAMETINKCFVIEDDKRKAFYEETAIRLLLWHLNSHEEYADSDLELLADLFICVNKNANPESELHVLPLQHQRITRSRKDSDRFFELILPKVAQENVSLVSYPLPLRCACLDRILKEIAKVSQPESAKIGGEHKWTAMVQWYLREMVGFAQHVSEQMWVALRAGMQSNPDSHKIIQECLLPEVKRLAQAEPPLSPYAASEILFTVTQLKNLSEEDQKICFELWKQSITSSGNNPLIFHLSSDTRHLNRQIIQHIAEFPHLYKHLTNSLKTLIYVILGHDKEWIKENIISFKKIMDNHPKVIKDCFIPLSQVLSQSELTYLLGKPLNDKQMELVEEARFCLVPSYLAQAKALIKKPVIPLFDNVIEPRSDFKLPQVTLELLNSLDETCREFFSRIEGKSLVIESELSNQEIVQFYEQYKVKLIKLLTVGKSLAEQNFLELARTIAQNSKLQQTTKSHLSMLDSWYAKTSIAYVVNHFDLLNFDDSSAEDFVEEEEMIIDGKQNSVDECRYFLQQLVGNLILKIKFAAVPADPQEAEIFYDEMTNYMQHIVFHLLKNPPHTAFESIVELCSIGGQCAVTYQEDLPLLCYSFLKQAGKIQDSYEEKLTLKEKLIVFLHKQRWRWFNDQTTGLENDANSLQLMKQLLEEPLGLYRKFKPSVNANSNFAQSNIGMIADAFKVKFEWQVNKVPFVIKMIKKGFNATSGGLDKQDFYNWFSSSKQSEDTLSLFVNQQSGKLNRKAILAMLLHTGIIKPNQ